MKILKQTSTELIIEQDAVHEVFDNSWLLPVIGLIALVPAILLPLFYWDESFPREVLLTFLAFTTISVLFASAMPLLSSILQDTEVYWFDKAASQLTFEHKASTLTAKNSNTRQWKLNDIFAVELDEYRGVNWLKFYQIKLVLKSGGKVVLTSLRQRQTYLVAHSLRNFLDLPK